jgi:hypothetical protein
MRLMLDSKEVTSMSPSTTGSMVAIKMICSIYIALPIYYIYLLIRSPSMLLINQARPQLIYLGADVVAASRCS